MGSTKDIVLVTTADSLSVCIYVCMSVCMCMSRGLARTFMECVVATSICLVPLDGGLCATDYDRAAHRREASIIKDHCVGILSSSWACTVISGDCGRNICFLSGSS